MNQRNVEALFAIMEPHDACGAARGLAEILAAAGVLVPSAVSRNEIDALLRLNRGGPSWSEEDDRLFTESGESPLHRRFREDLERIAKGEPAAAQGEE